MNSQLEKTHTGSSEFSEEDTAKRRAAWRRALTGIAIGLTVVGVLYYDAIASAVSVWNASAAHQFSYLIIPLSAYFIWLRRAEVFRMTPQPMPYALLAFLPFAALWLVSEVTQLSVGLQFATLGIIQTLVLVMLGWRLYSALLFPLLFLWLLVPFGDFLIPPLTEMTMMATVAGLQLTGMEVSSTGTSLLTEIAQYRIVEECSAFDFLVGNLVISLVFANLIYRSKTRRTFYVLAAMPMAILANNFRTVTIILITENSNGHIDLANDHEVYGWIIFALAVAAQMVVGLRYRDTAEETGRAPHAAFKPLGRVQQIFVASVGVLGTIFAPAYLALAVERHPLPENLQLCAPATFSSSSGAGTWQPDIPGTQARFHRVLDDEGRKVNLFVGYFWRQGPGAELISWANRLSDGTNWRTIVSRHEMIEIGGRSLEVVSTRILGPSARERVVWSWFWVDGQMTAQSWRAKAMQARAVLLGGDSRAAFIALSTDAANGKPATLRILQEALKGIAIGDVLRDVRRVTSNSGSCN